VSNNDHRPGTDGPDPAPVTAAAANGARKRGARQPLIRTVIADLAAVAKLKGRSRLNLVAAVDVLALPGTWAVILFRVASACHWAHLRPLSRILYFLNVVLFGADLAPGARVGPGLCIPHPVGTGWGSGLTAGEGVIMTGAVRFGTAAAQDAGRMGQPTVGDHVILLDGAKAMGPVVIGDRAVVAANALVLHDVPPDAIVVGQPARVVKMRYERPGVAEPAATAYPAEPAAAQGPHP
jgi:serine O-acetyltransferase